jgi:hypothetical protein
VSYYVLSKYLEQLLNMLGKLPSLASPKVELFHNFIYSTQSHFDLIVDNFREADKAGGLFVGYFDHSGHAEGGRGLHGRHRSSGGD